MIPSRVRGDLSEAVSEAIEGLWGFAVSEVGLSAPPNERFGDVSCQVAMRLSGELGMPPREVAEALAAELGGRIPAVAAVTVDGPGFINFTFQRGYLTRVSSSLAREEFSSLLPDDGGGRVALVEYVSSNPTGPLNVGHCRQAVLGEAISRLLEAVGWRVKREYYFNDSGRQMELLGESIAARYLEKVGGPSSLEMPEKGYRGDYVRRWAAELASEKGDGLVWPDDSELFVSYGRERAMRRIREDLALLEITFDCYFPESDLLEEDVPRAIDQLGGTGPGSEDLVYEDPEEEGKLWLRLRELGRPADRVIRRSDGTYTYRMPDIAYHLNKFERGYDLIVDVFGSDHLDTSRDVRAALSALLGNDEVQRRLRVVIHQFVTLVRAGRKVKMSTRAANFVTMRDLVEEVGSVDVTRYLFLTRRSEAHMDFDLDLAVEQSEENPVYYVQYAHARIAGIVRKAVEEGVTDRDVDPEGLPELLDGEHERRLMRLLEVLPHRVAQSAELLEPHRITEMLADLATAFHGFYQNVRVIDSSRPKLSAARLLLCKACRNSIRGMLGILNVDSPDTM
ncbi:arginine--tRNA ligase [Candidatus Fermentibacteria bacterium]|nr:arginine--tRNA ligase [Candidatus Fermentibacteria bacterium]